MKLAFLCVGILVSCSVCASGDLEFYPGIKLDLSAAPRYRRQYPLYKYPTWPLPAENDRPTFSIPHQFTRQLEQLLAKSRIEHLKAELPYRFGEPDNGAYDNGDETFDLYDSLRYRTEGNAQTLNDVRPYPHEEDFTFGEEEEEEEEEGGGERNRWEEEREKETKYLHRLEDGGTKGATQLHRVENVEGKGAKHLHGVENVEGKEAKHLHRVENVEGEEATVRNEVLANAKFAKDPTEFAYPPTDPRFFRSHNTEEPLEVTPDNTIKDEGDIYLAHRSEDIRNEKANGKFNEHLPLRANDNSNVNGFVSVQAAVPPSDTTTVYVIAIVAGISAAATVGLIAVGIGWYNLQKHVKNASDVEYPAYGVTGPNKDVSPSGDRRLAQSAQMYHYQHQKQQIIAMESRAAAGERHGSVSEADSDEENEEGDYTVYECPGLAPTGEMEVKNPLFQDDPTPAQTPPVNKSNEEKK